MALDDFILKKNGENIFDQKSAIQNNLIAQLLANDLNTQAINLVDEISKNDMESYIDSKETIFNCLQCKEISNELIAYQIENGKPAKASKLASLLKIKKAKENSNEIETRKFLLNLISPKIDRKVLYNLMIHGNLLGKNDKRKDHDVCGPYGCGWLTNLSMASPIIRRSAYKYFENMNYPEFARHMKENNHYSHTREEFPLAKGLGAEYQTIANRYEALIKATNSGWVGAEATNSKDEDYKTLVKITERGLPAKYLNQAPVEPELRAVEINNHPKSTLCRYANKPLL